MVSDASLFDVPEPARRPQRAQQKPEWTKYRPVNPVKCSDCTVRLADNHGDAPAAADARYRRRFSGSVAFYCAPHAHTRRAQDRGERTG